MGLGVAHRDKENIFDEVTWLGYHIFYLLPEVKEMNLFGMIFRVPPGA